MNRDFRRERDRQRRRDADRAEREGGEAADFEAAKQRKRTDVRTFLKEVRSELRRVHWPSRKELASYSIVVLVFVLVLGSYIFGIDQLFGAFILQIFG